jgi:hypothetical protein
MVSPPGSGDHSRTEQLQSHLRTPASAAADKRGGLTHAIRE